jgi:hypothetical protein
MFKRGVSSSLFAGFKICGFAISGLIRLKNLRINHKKIAVCDWQTEKENLLAHL